MLGTFVRYSQQLLWSHLLGFQAWFKARVPPILPCSHLKQGGGG
jgi:hypothetical protein